MAHRGLLPRIVGTFNVSGASLMAQQVKSLPAMPETRVQSLCREDPLKKKWQPIPVLLPGKSHGQRNLAGYSYGTAKSCT